MISDMEMGWKRFGLQAGLILLLTLLAFLPAMRAGFIWDDDTFLTENPRIKAEDGLYRFWCTAEAPDYFPLSSSSLWLEWRLWGMNATGYHVVNVVLHAVSSVLIWLVLKRLKIPGAWVAGLVFAVHPVNVESVAWVTQRKNTLAMLFYVASIFLYLRSESEKGRHWYLLSLGAFLLALLSKSSVVMLPFVLLGAVWWQQGKIVRRDVIRSIPFFGLSGFLGLVTIWFQYHRAIGETVVRADNFLSRLASAGWAVWFYLGKAVVPYRLSFVYSRWELDAFAITSYLPGVILVGWMVLFWWYRKSWGRPLLFGLGYFVVTLFPVLGFFNIYFMRYSFVADHWQYSSIVGIIALVVGTGTYAFNRWGKGLPQLATIAGAILVGLLSFLTWRQSQIYHNPQTLWMDTISKNPDAWMAHGGLGYVLAEQDRLEEATAHFLEALRIEPDDEIAHYNLGNVLARQGKLGEAIMHFSEALRIKPDHEQARRNRRIALMMQKKSRRDHRPSF